MTDLTTEAAAGLRKPFPATAIGKLPKPYQSTSQKGTCKECGGHHGLPAAHLDYVGHAATTDRLLSVDPAWSWEPFALDVNGLPALDGRGNLWIRLTVCGVTRIGVGDGKSAKEIIGDAIRNAAMRFGVALDLWGKEELEQAHAPARPLAAAPPPAVTAGDFTRTPQTGYKAPPGQAEAATSPARPRPGTEPTKAKRDKMFASFRDAGFTSNPNSESGRRNRLAYIAHAIGREVETSNELNSNEVGVVIAMLEADAQTAESGESS